MDLFQYIKEMKELSTPVATVAVVLLCLFLTVIIFKMLGGMRRGGWKQLVRTGLTAAAAVISYLVALIISNSIMGSADMISIEELIAFIEGAMPGTGEILTQLLSGFDPAVFEYVIVLPATVLLLPVLATLIFLLINLLLKFVRSIIIKLVGFTLAKSNSQRLYGALLGAAEAIIWVVMVTLPITGILGIVDSACDNVLSSERADDEDFVGAYQEYIKPFTENPAFSLMDYLGVQSLSDGIATVTIDNTKTNLREELIFVANIGLIELPALGDADFGALTEENKLSLRNIADVLGRSPFMSKVLAGVVQSSSGLINSVFPFDMAGEYGEFLSAAMDFLEGVNADSLEDDVNTIMAVYFAISDSGVIKEIEGTEDADIMAILKEKQRFGDDTLADIAEILRGNERTAPILKAMTKALISSLKNGVPSSYDSIKESVNAVISANYDSTDALTLSLNNALCQNGIMLESEIVGSIAEYIDSELSETGEFSDEEFCGLMLHYYDAYLEYIEG